MRSPFAFAPPATPPATALLRLTALWGLAESGLGGVLFALKIPLTGFLIGAISVVLLSLIARISHYSARQLAGSTVVVLLVKAAVSPHSPPAAYLAVSFQGFLAAALFGCLKQNRLAPVLLGAITMAESALQKVIVLTLLFGKSMWEAVNKAAGEMAKIFSVAGAHNYALWIVGCYTLLYALWGMLVGRFAARLPQQIAALKPVVLKACDPLREKEARLKPWTPKSRSVWAKAWPYGGILIFILLTFLLSGGRKESLFILARSLAAVLLLLTVVQPLLKTVFNHWLRRRSEAEKDQSRQVLQLLPELRSYLPAAYAVAKSQKGILNRLGYFLTAMVILTLYSDAAANDSDL